MNRTPTPRSRPNAGEVDDLVVVDPPDHDDVHLHRVQAGVERRVDPGEHPVELVPAGQDPERLGVERVERDVDPLQAGRREVVGQLREPDPVRGHRQVDAERLEQLEQAGQVGPDRRLAAGDADPVEAPPLDADPGDPGQLLVAEHLGAGQPLHPLGRHAVGAPEIAAVRHREPQIPHPTGEGIDQRHRGRQAGRGHPTRVRRSRFSSSAVTCIGENTEYSTAYAERESGR